MHEIVISPEYYATHNSLIVRYLLTDWPPGIFGLIHLPHALGMDILAWTLGLGVLLFTHQGSPYSTLGYLLDPHPTLALIAVVAFNMLAGALLMMAVGAFFRLVLWLDNMPGRTSRSRS